MLLEKQAPLFLPQFVAEVAAGYFWDPRQAAGSGATFTVPEGNGKTAYDLVTPSAGAAPSLTTVNGRPAILFTNGSPDRLLRTAATKQRGFTGSMMIFGWVSRAANLGSIIGHARTATNLLLQYTPSDIRFVASDGSNQEARFPLPTGGLAAGPVYYEFVIDLTQAATAKMQAWYNRVQQTPTLAATFGSSVQDTSEFIQVGGLVSDNTTANYAADFTVGTWGITSGVPSSANRDRLYHYGALA